MSEQLRELLEGITADLQEVKNLANGDSNPAHAFMWKSALNEAEKAIRKRFQPFLSQPTARGAVGVMKREELVDAMCDAFKNSASRGFGIAITENMKAALAIAEGALPTPPQQWLPITDDLEGWIIVPREDGMYSGRRIVCRCDERDKGYGVNYLDEEANPLEISPTAYVPLLAAPKQKG